MAIVLHEEGLYDRTQLYATDFNDQIIRRAREATYPVSLIKDYTANYQKAGGQSSFAEYYTANTTAPCSASSSRTVSCLPTTTW